MSLAQDVSSSEGDQLISNSALTTSDEGLEVTEANVTEEDGNEEEAEEAEEGGEGAGEDEDDDEEVDPAERGYDELESLCMSCGESGITRMMMHKIPYFRELFIASFFCDHCGERNNEVTFGGAIQQLGCQYELLVTKPSDLDRQLVKSDSAAVRLPEIEFEIPPLTQKGEISTIEGFLRTAATNLGLYQEERMRENPEVGARVAEVILALTLYSAGQNLPFTIAVDDPSGNSFIQNPFAPSADPHMKLSYYHRTAEQDRSLGLQPEKGDFHDDTQSNYSALMKTNFGTEDAEGNVRLGRSEVIAIPSNCPNCGAMGESLTALTDIPHFKELIIMAFNCGICGFRNSEVKGGGAVPARGTEVRLNVTGPDDLKRDCLKSDSAMVQIPELELELGHGTLGGAFTTVEGLLFKIHDNLMTNNPFAVGDSATNHHSAESEQSEVKAKFEAFLSKLKLFGEGKVFPFSVILRDPLGNSFISAPLGSFLPPEMDANITMTDFDRSYEDNEEFGLNDINTADFETGVDHTEEIKPDRVTHVLAKGADHPTLFATGVPDATQGGVYFGIESTGCPPSAVKKSAMVPSYSSPAVVTTTADEGTNAVNGADQYWHLGEAHGWRALKPGERDDDNGTVELEAQGEASSDATEIEDDPNLGRRVFDPRDLTLKFDPREEFAGGRQGFVFRMGAKGLGYYEDTFSFIAPTPAAAPAQDSSL